MAQRLFVPFLLVALATAAAGCSCGNEIPTRPRDAGIGGNTDAGPGVDSGPPIPGMDAGPPRDAGPRIDSGCDLATPIMNEIIGDPPDMLLVVDVSGSMCSPLFESFPAMTSKLAIMKTALRNLVEAKEARINFGMMLFPAGGECGAGTVRNPIAPRNAAPIVATLNTLRDGIFDCATMNTGATPTHISLDAALDYYATIPENPIGRYVLLATDGLPNCGAEQPDGSTAETVDETVAAIEALHAAGIQTYVLGFGSGFSGGGAALSRMATAGGTMRPYNASSAAELDTALDMIAAEILPASCTIELSGPMRDPRLFQVSFDGGGLIPRNEAHTSGWDYDPATNTITFYGAECTQLQSGSVANVDVDFGCPGPLI
jgi:hypothetical protein